MKYLVKWCALNYSSSTWEYASAFRDESKIQRFLDLTRAPTEVIEPERPEPSQWKPLTEVDAANYPNNNELRPWQIEGVNWLLFNWYNRRGSILADEMGLGAASFVVALFL